jgi:hypothetical protein
MTSHNRTPSVASTLTDLSESVNNASDRSSSSVSSNVSVTSDDFKLKVNELIASQALPISRLEIRARSFIDDLKNGGEYNSPLYGGSKIRKEVKLHRVLEAMLHYSFECGKEVGRRYTACAICACHGTGDDIQTQDGHSPDRIEKKLAYLQSLGTTWLSHLLFVCMRSCSIACYYD